MQPIEEPNIIRCSKCNVEVTNDDIECVNGYPVCIMCIGQKRYKDFSNNK